MSHSEICPVCEGRGTIPTGEITTAGTLEKPCHGCPGTGWVTVHDTPYGPLITTKPSQGCIDWGQSVFKEEYLPSDYSPLLDFDPTEEF